MSIPTPSLQEFIELVPICPQTAKLTTVLDIFSQGQCDRLAVVSEQQYPLGLLYLRSLMPHLWEEQGSKNQKLPVVAARKPIFQQLLSQLAGSLIQPLQVLSAQLTLNQLKPQLLSEGNQPWALVDPAGRFLGLLDTGRLLKFLVVQPKVLWTKTNQPESLLVDQLRGKERPLHPIASLIQLLEKLPLPLRLQTSTGEALGQNLTWRQQIGDWREQNSHWQEDGNLKQTVGQLSSILNAERTGANIEYYQQMERSPHAAPIDQALPLLSMANSTQWCEPKKGTEKLWQFIKLPLSGDNWGLDADGLGDNQLLNPNTVWLVLAQDITEQQQVSKELAAKNADLIQLNRFKDEFLACISHELKTPLTAILGLSSLLKDQVVGALNERQGRYAHLIYQGGRQLMTLVNDILDLTRIETRQLELTLEPLNIQTVCDRAYLQAQQLHLLKTKQFGEATIETHYTIYIEPGLETLIADELRLRQMLIHLLSNALKFTEAQGEIGLTVSNWDGWIAFTVWDTGIGIPEQKQHLIFQKFQQLENPLTRRFEGAGLGLVLTQRLAHLHGGDISFISKVGQGSQFTLLLPPCPPNLAAQGISEDDVECRMPPNIQLLARPTKNRLVLIVEAAPQYIEDLSRQLMGLGYRAAIARSGTEAIEKARRLQPSVVLLNPFLPMLSGWDVLTLIKSDAQTGHIPVVVTATRGEKDLAYQNRADGFLSLPVQEPELKQYLERLQKQQPSLSHSVTVLYITSGLVGAAASITNPEIFPTYYRVLEAEELEQAELLARVWHPNAILLDGAGLLDADEYLRQLSQRPALASLPIITLDLHTTQAANQISGLSVFPCLASGEPGNTNMALLQVIQVAAGIACKPRILVVDVGTKILDFSTSSGQLFPNLENNCSQVRSQDMAFSLAEQEAESSPYAFCCLLPEAGSDRHTEESLSCNLYSFQEWLQALIQYLQIAGFRSFLSHSWADAIKQLQGQDVDLLLINIGDIKPDTAIIAALKSLEKMPFKPPILILDRRTGAMLAEATTPEYADNERELELTMAAIATQIIQGPTQSMTELLGQIHQILT